MGENRTLYGRPAGSPRSGAALRVNDAAPLPEGFKMTALGPLPAHWQVVRLGEIFTPVSKKTRETLIRDEVVYRLLTVRLYAKGITLRSEEKGNRIKTKKLYYTKQGDFVFSKVDARNGAWGFVPRELDGGLVSGDFPILTLDHFRTEQSFVELQLAQPIIWEPLRNIAVGTTNRRRLQTLQLLDVIVSLPPIEEQRAIARVLQAVDRKLEAEERRKEALAALFKSLLAQLMTGRIRVAPDVGAARRVAPTDANSLEGILAAEEQP